MIWGRVRKIGTGGKARRSGLIRLLPRHHPSGQDYVAPLPRAPFTLGTIIGCGWAPAASKASWAPGAARRNQRWCQSTTAPPLLLTTEERAKIFLPPPFFSSGTRGIAHLEKRRP